MDDFAAMMEMMSQNSTAPMDMDPAAREKANAAWAEAQQQQQQPAQQAEAPGQALVAPQQRLTPAECERVMRATVLSRWQQKREEDLATENPDEWECMRLSRMEFVRKYCAGQLDEDNPNPTKPRILNLQEWSRDRKVPPKRRELRMWQFVAARRLLLRANARWSVDYGVPTPNASLLAVHDVGLGKTITAILALAAVYNKNPNPARFKALIVVPKSVLQIWYDTLQSWTTLSGRVFVLRKEDDINGVKLRDEERYVKKRFELAHVVLTTADTIVQAYKTFMYDDEAEQGKRRSKPRSACIKRIRKELRDEPVHELFQKLELLSLLVIDEIHAYKGRNTWWGIVLREMAKRAFCKLGLTGTPITNSPEEIADLAMVLNVKEPYLHRPDWYREKDTGDLTQDGVEEFQQKYMDRVDVTFATEELPERKYFVLHYDPFVGLLPDGTMNVKAVREHNVALTELRSILKATKDSKKKTWDGDDLEALDRNDPNASNGMQEEDGSGDVAAAAPQGKEAKEQKKLGGKVMALQRKIEQAEFSTVLAKYGATKFSSSSTTAGELQKMLAEAAEEAPSEVMALIVRVILDRQAAGHKRIAVFSESVAVHLILMRFLEGRDVGELYLFDSSVGDDMKRADLVRYFKGCDKGVLLFTKAGGVGITLSPECAVMLSIGPLGWSPVAITQAFGRVYRIGAKTPVEIIQFVARRSLTAIKMHTHEDKRDRLGKAVVDADYSEFSGALDGEWKTEKEALASLVPLDEESGNYLMLERQVDAMRIYQDQLNAYMAGKRPEEPEKPVGWPQAPVPPSRMPLPPVSFVRSADNPEKWIATAPPAAAAGPGLSTKAQGKRPMSQAQMAEEELEQAVQVSRQEAEAMEEDQVVLAQQASMQEMHKEDLRRNAANQE